MLKFLGYAAAAALVGAVFFLFSGVGGAKASADDAHAWVAQGALLLDVRTPAEFAAGHLDGAVNLPVDQVAEGIGKLAATDKPIVVYCRSGARSASATRALKGKGYEQVLDLGPMSAW